MAVHSAYARGRKGDGGFMSIYGDLVGKAAKSFISGMTTFLAGAFIIIFSLVGVIIYLLVRQ